MTVTNQRNLAVLIDAENTTATYAHRIMARAATLGRLTDRRAYGDWTTSILMSWKKVLCPLAIRPQQQFRYRKGKNTSDGALIMDAMSIIHARNVDGICIVSSDSDYIGLALRIRTEGLMAYGFGTQLTMREFVSACDEFVFLEDLESS